MANRNFSGFETGDTPGTTNECNLTGGTFSCVTTPVKSGNFSLRCNPTTTNTGWVSFGLNGNNAQPTTFSLADCYFHFAFRYATKPASASEEFAGVRRSGAEQATLRLTSTGTILLFQNSDLVTTPVATGTAVLAADTWYYIVGRIQTSGTGAYAIHLYTGDACVLLESLTGTGDFGVANSEGFRLGKITNRNGNGVDFFYDDVAIDDAALPAPGGRVYNLMPNANGTNTAWNAGTGASDYLELDDTLPADNDTTYIKNPAAASISTFNLQNVAGVGITGTVQGVKPWAKIREDTSVTSSQFLRLISGGTTSDNATGFNGTTTYVWLHKFHATDPNTAAAWTLAALDAIEVGVREANAVADRCTAVGAQVYFDPADWVDLNGAGGFFGR